jgi:hypothetical protein
VENRDFVLNQRITHRRRLQAVAQGLVVEKDLTRGPQRLRVQRVPVVDQVGVQSPVSSR